LVLPLVSVTVHVTMFVPAGKPIGALFVIENAPQLSLVTGVPRAIFVAVLPEFAVTVTFDGQVMVGGSVSRIVTVKKQLALLPLRSVAVKRLVVTPFGNVVPLGSPPV